MAADSVHSALALDKGIPHYMLFGINMNACMQPQVVARVCSHDSNRCCNGFELPHDIMFKSRGCRDNNLVQLEIWVFELKELLQTDGRETSSFINELHLNHA